MKKKWKSRPKNKQNRPRTFQKSESSTSLENAQNITLNPVPIADPNRTNKYSISADTNHKNSKNLSSTTLNDTNETP